jgi:hypothetical protein
VSYSQSRQEETGQPDVVSRTYSLIVPTYPLPALSVTFGATRSDNFTGGRKTRTTDRYSLVSRGRIYPDLTAVWSLSLTENETFDSGDSVGDSTTLSNRLNLNARLYRNLTSDLVISWRQIETEGDSSQTADANLSLRYRPSDFLGLRGTYTTTFISDTPRPDRFSLGLDLQLVNTQKTRLTLNATHTQADQTSDNFALFGSWEISRNLSLLTRGSYTMAVRNAYSFQASLSLRL